MRKARYFVGTLTAGALALSAASPGVAAATKTVAIWEMNERPGATTMVDTGDNGIDGTIGSAVITREEVDGATGYGWTNTRPNSPPAQPERLVVVEDRWLKPGNANYAVTVRFRTTRPFGNVIQKGQSQNRRGFFKWQIPNGKLTCVFRGYDNDTGDRLSRAVNSGSTLLNDGAWHVVTCKRTQNQVRMTVDGSLVRRTLGPTGRIYNKEPLTIGGKSNCDQVTTTCDYFVGSIDYVRIARG